MPVPTLILLSDLWGAADAQWMAHYTAILGAAYAVTCLHSPALAGLPLADMDQASRHAAFVNGGIDRAAEQLRTHIPAPDVVIGCSVGGVIAWRAALLGWPVGRLVTISATRLRYETASPNVPTSLYFGTDDPYRPSDEWLTKIALPYHLLPGGHDIYKDEKRVEKLIVRAFNGKT